MAFQIEIAKLEESLGKKFMESISKIREQEESQQHWTIYRIPDVIRQLCQHAYNPSVVSIGPLHRGSSHLQAMEPIKMFYFLLLTQAHVQACVNKMLYLEPRARICYAELVQFYENVEASVSHESSTSFHPNFPPPIFDISNHGSLQERIRTKFTETMLLDGCFILQLLRRDYQRRKARASPPPDPILDNDFVRLAVEQDLLRLENQIPFEVLQALFRITTSREPSLHFLMLSFFGEMMGLPILSESREEEMMGRLQEFHEDEMKPLQESHEDEMKRLQEYHEDEMKRLQESHEEKMMRFSEFNEKKSAEEKIMLVRKFHKEESYEKEMMRLWESHEKKMMRLWESHEEEMMRLEESCEVESHEVKIMILLKSHESHEEKMRRLREYEREKMMQLRNMMQLWESHEEKMMQLRESHEKMMPLRESHEQKSHEEKMMQLRESHKEKMMQLWESHKEKMMQLWEESFRVKRMILYESHELPEVMDRSHVTPPHRFLHLIHGSHKPPPCHILHLIHCCYSPPADYLDLSKLSEKPEFRYSATQLDLAGVKLVPGKTSDLFDLKFCTAPSCFRLFRRARLEIPPFQITYSTEALLRNLIAFEQCRDTGFRYFTSYAFLMDRLINSAEDVDLLVDAGVVQNYMGSSEEASHLFNNICRNVYVGRFYFTQPCKEVEAYCSGIWSRCMAKLKRDYFSSPWTGVSVLAAIILFTLTFLQTIYTMLSYY